MARTHLSVPFQKISQRRSSITTEKPATTRVRPAPTFKPSVARDRLWSQHVSTDAQDPSAVKMTNASAANQTPSVNICCRLHPLGECPLSGR